MRSSAPAVGCAPPARKEFRRSGFRRHACHRVGTNNCDEVLLIAVCWTSDPPDGESLCDPEHPVPRDLYGGGYAEPGAIIPIENGEAARYWAWMCEGTSDL